MEEGRRVELWVKMSFVVAIIFLIYGLSLWGEEARQEVFVGKFGGYENKSMLCLRGGETGVYWCRPENGEVLVPAFTQLTPDEWVLNPVWRCWGVNETALACSSATKWMDTPSNVTFMRSYADLFDGQSMVVQCGWVDVHDSMRVRCRDGSRFQDAIPLHILESSSVVVCYNKWGWFRCAEVFLSSEEHDLCEHMDSTIKGVLGEKRLY